MPTPSHCPSCGAVWNNAATCQDAFHQMLYWEAENPALGEVHHKNCSPKQGVSMTIQVIQNNGKPEWAVVPYEDYLRLIEQTEMLQDVQDYDTAKAELKNGEEELIPVQMVDALLSGENPIKVWREYRSFSQSDLAKKAGISVPYISQLETNKRRGSLVVLSAIAKALYITLDDISPS